MGSPQLLYVHERNRARDQVANGLFTGTTLFGSLGLGFGVEWLRNREALDYRRTSLGFSLGSDTLALGATYHAFVSRTTPSFERLSSWDIGLSARPWREFSYSVVARDINAPEPGRATACHAPSRWALACAPSTSATRWAWTTCSAPAIWTRGGSPTR